MNKYNRIATWEMCWTVKQEWREQCKRNGARVTAARRRLREIAILFCELKTED